MALNKQIQRAIKRLLRELQRADDDYITVSTEEGHDYTVGFYACGSICCPQLEEMTDIFFNSVLDLIDKMEGTEGQTDRFNLPSGFKVYSGRDEKNEPETDGEPPNGGA